MTNKLSPEERSALETRWLELTKQTLPSLAVKREWPIRYDHCFQRVMLDAACGGCWYDHIPRRPAYRSASDVILQRAVSLAESVASEAIDLLNFITKNFGPLNAMMERAGMSEMDI